MRKKSNALLALLLTGAMTVTSVSPAFAAEDFSADAEVQAVQDVTEEEFDADVSDVQGQDDLGEVGMWKMYLPVVKNLLIRIPGMRLSG